MTDTETQLIAALIESERIAEATLATLAAITLARVEHPVAAVALSTGELVHVAPDRLVVVAEQRLFDTFIAQLHAVKAAAAALTHQLTAPPKDPA